MKPIKYILLLIILSYYAQLHAQALKTQEGHAYGYDANGNRTSASVIYLQTTLKSATLPLDQVIPGNSFFPSDSALIPEQGWESGKSEPLGDFEVKVYPNPTHGIIILEILRISDKQLAASENSIKIFDMQGILIKNYSPLTKYTIIDLSEKPNTTYLLKLIAGGQIKDYKIIKE
jgi:hypothetical protein